MRAYDDDAETVAQTVAAVPGVVTLHRGMFGEVATYLPGRRIPGIRIADGRIEVHVVIAVGAPIRETAAAIRQAVVAALPSATVDVTVEDIAPGPETIHRPVQGGHR